MKTGKRKPHKRHSEILIGQIIRLLEVKSLISLSMTGAMIWGFRAGVVPSELFGGMFGSVITYFFMRRNNDFRRTDSIDNGNNGDGA